MSYAYAYMLLLMMIGDFRARPTSVGKMTPDAYMPICL